MSKISEFPTLVNANLTPEEAAAYSNTGINKIRQLSSMEDCDFVLWVGATRLITRKLFDLYIARMYSI